MKTNGIRISDAKNDVISVKLLDILSLVENGETFYWGVIFSDVMPYPEYGASLIAFEKELSQSENGVCMNWEELQSFASMCYQEIDLDVIGAKNKACIHRYPDEKKMYAECDIVMQMMDSSYWEIHSKDLALLKRCEEKFTEIEWV